MASLLVFQSCEKDELDPIVEDKNIVPESFMVEIPSSISSRSSVTTLKNLKIDNIQGDEVYEHLRNFVAVGESAAEIIQGIMTVIAQHNLNRPIEFTFISDDDNRSKHLIIVENATFEGKQWQYKMTITDVDEGSEDGNNIALQIFWSRNPIVGIALLNPYNIDRVNNSIDIKDVMYRLDYSEANDMGYEKYMIVTLVNLPLGDPETDIYRVSNLKMFVGKNGDVIDLYGNTEHPNAYFFNEDTGFDWAFVASASTSMNIAVAEVGLPPMYLDSSDRNTLLVEYSIKNVFEQQILSVWPGVSQEVLDAYLVNLTPPAFFSSDGFIQGGTPPSNNYNSLVGNILLLTPYNPKYINELVILFD